MLQPKASLSASASHGFRRQPRESAGRTLPDMIVEFAGSIRGSDAMCSTDRTREAPRQVGESDTDRPRVAFNIVGQLSNHRAELINGTQMCRSTAG